MSECLDTSVSQVKKRVVQVISAMAHHGYLELEGGELLVRFIVQNCALHDTYQVKKNNLKHLFQLPTFVEFNGSDLVIHQKNLCGGSCSTKADLAQKK